MQTYMCDLCGIKNTHGSGNDNVPRAAIINMLFASLALHNPSA